MTGLNYLRARWLDPNTGSFLSADPMGYVDSSNLYAFTGGDPVNGRDPTGMYEADFHYAITLYLAQRACLSPDVAKQIAEGAVRPDRDERAPIGSGIKAKAGSKAARERRRKWHFPKAELYTGAVEPGSEEAQKDVLAGLMAGNLTLFSEGLHTLQDSWSHQGIPSLGGYAGHPNARGGISSHDADLPFKYPADALKAAQATFNYLSAFASRHTAMRQCTGGGLTSWQDTQREVEEFFQLENRFEKKAWLAKRGIQMDDELWNDVTPGREDISRVRKEELRKRMDRRP